MAVIKSFPNNQDEYIGAEEVMRWHHGRTSGVFGHQGELVVSAVQNTMKVSVSDGTGWLSNNNVDGIVWWNDYEKLNGTKLQLTVAAADSTLNRIDRVIVEWKTTNYADLPEIKILKGTFSSTPTAPALTNNGILRQLSLARINIAHGTTYLTNSMITDERFNPAVCGIVTENVTVDTSGIANQVLTIAEETQAQATNIINNASSQLAALLNQYQQAISQVGSLTIPDLSVTRAKLASDALYSTLVEVTASRAIALTDLGATLKVRATGSNIELTLPATIFNAMPLGFEFAVLWYSADSVSVKLTGDIYFADSNNATFIKNAIARLNGRFVMAAFKKIASDTLLATGECEVSAT